jgi:hypothetical protein
MKNIEGPENLLCLTYPSNSNEWSIFDISTGNDYMSRPTKPKIHFRSTINDAKGKPISVPYLVDCTNPEKCIDFDRQISKSSSLYGLVNLENSNLFKVGNSFSFK